jgi:integrase/recombinase XerD
MLSSPDSEIIELWLEKQRSLHTQGCYRHDSARLTEHAKKPLAGITLADLQSFAQSLEVGLAPISRARTIAATRSLFAFCQRMRHLAANPAMELPLPRYEQRLAERILGVDDVQRLLAAEPEPRNRVLLNLVYAAGLRVSEACRLLWRNVRPRGDAGQITVFGKNGRTRSITLPAALWRELVSLRGDAGAEDPVFPSRTGRSLDRGRVRAIVRQAAERAGVSEPVSPHWLRHAHASHALDHGAPIHLVQATLGHSSVATTSAYLHARPGDSSARFLFGSDRIALPSSGTGVMNVSPANDSRERRNMTTFIIDKDNNITALGESTTPGDAETFSSSQELAKLTADWPTGRLAETWNSFAGVAPFDDLKPVKKFTSRNVAVDRIWAAVQRLSRSAAPQATPTVPAKRKSKKSPTKSKRPAGAKKPADESRSNKKAEVIALMKRAKGATLAEIMEATAWQRHTIRGFISLLGSKGGEKIESSKNAAGERTYRIAK